MSNPGGPGLNPPGWYPDPGDPQRERFWFGTQWSDQVRSPGAKPPPSAGSVWSQPWTPPAPAASAKRSHLVRNLAIAAAIVVIAVIIVVLALVV